MIKDLYNTLALWIKATRTLHPDTDFAWIQNAIDLLTVPNRADLNQALKYAYDQPLEFVQTIKQIKTDLGNNNNNEISVLITFYLAHLDSEEYKDELCEEVRKALIIYNNHTNITTVNKSNNKL